MQMVPQVPQLLLSLLKSVQVPPQLVRLVEQQRPFEQLPEQQSVF